MIEKNYIILAHSAPGQVLRLVNRLNDGHSFFYIHVDKRAGMDGFSRIKDNSNVAFVTKREACSWGDFSLVQATLNAIEQIVNDDSKAYTILLSESCYPLAGNDIINAYLEQYKGCEHIDIAPVAAVWKNWQDRLEKYKINLSHNRGDYLLYPPFLEDGLSAGMKRLKEIVKLAWRRKTPDLLVEFSKTFRKRHFNIEHVGGSAWWGMSFVTLKRVAAFVKTEPAYSAFHKNTLLPDEIFFQTILQLLSQDGSIKYRPSLTYVNWTRENTPLPVTFNESDTRELSAQLQNNKLFARKFVAGYSDKILDLLDEPSYQSHFQ